MHYIRSLQAYLIRCEITARKQRNFEKLQPQNPSKVQIIQNYREVIKIPSHNSHHHQKIMKILKFIQGKSLKISFA